MNSFVPIPFFRFTHCLRERDSHNMTATADPPSSAVEEAKERLGASWRQVEELVIPKNRLGIVFFGLMCTVFLAALDQTIVATALPTIVAELGGGKNYSYVGSVYLLVSTSLGPLYGKLSNVLGRKPMLYGCILIFLIGSALCGAAQNMTWLIVSRAVQGIGGGGVMQLVQITMSDIVPLQERGKYSGFVGATWSISSVVGPLVGGVFTDHLSWRWCFWINLPTGGLAGALLFFFLNLNPHQGRPFRDHIQEFDFVGLVVIVTGTVCLLLGFNSSETTWHSAETIALLVVGGTLLILGSINEIFTKRSPIIPPRLFKTRTTGFTLVSVFLHSVVYFTATFQCITKFLGASATSSGVRMLPYSLIAAVMAAVSGVVVTRTRSYRPIMWFGWTVMTLGSGLMIMLDNTTTTAEQEIYPFIAALGAGCLFYTPLIAVQAAMPVKDMATSTGTLAFLRTLGSTVGITIGETIISNVLHQKLQGIQGLTIDTSAAALNNNIRQISSISNPTVRNEVMHAYSRSISTVWLVNTPLSMFGLFLVLFIRGYTLKRIIIRGGEKKLGDAETGAEQVKAADDSKVTESESLEMQKMRSFDDVTELAYSVNDTSTQKKTEA
ncbi:MFS general substrate transporter [Suillus lakei]|nr:MFS general substrate transporter [Suillus lakei]